MVVLYEFQGAAASTLRERELHVEGGLHCSNEPIDKLGDTKQVPIENMLNSELRLRI
jgi:hypothetical protein